MFDQLNFSLKYRATSLKNNSSDQQQKQQVKELEQKSATPTQPQHQTSLLISKTNNSNSLVKFQRKTNVYTNFKSLKLFDQTGTENKNNIDNLRQMSKTQSELYSNVDKTSFTIPTSSIKSGTNKKKLLPINKASIFSSSGNANSNKTLSSLNALTNNLPSPSSSSSNLTHFNEFKQLTRENNKLIKSNSNINIKNSQYILNNIRSKTINFLLDFNLDNRNSNSVPLAASASLVHSSSSARSNQKRSSTSVNNSIINTSNSAKMTNFK